MSSDSGLPFYLQLYTRAGLFHKVGLFADEVRLGQKNKEVLPKGRMRLEMDLDSILFW